MTVFDFTLNSRCWSCVTLASAIFLVGIVFSQGAENARVENYEVAESEPPMVFSNYVKTLGTPKRIDACFCCANKQLSFCCSACLERDQARVNPKQSQSKSPGSLPPMEKSLDSSEQLIEQRMSAAERVLSHRIKTLRVSACSCCQRSGGRSRKCCLWCGTMAYSG